MMNLTHPLVDRPLSNMDELIDAVELSDAIQSGLQMLTPEYRMTITLVDVDGLEYAEAAQILGVPIGQSKVGWHASSPAAPRTPALC